jgi:hypothetical protein
MTEPQRLANQWLLVIGLSSAVAIIAALVADGSPLTVLPMLWFLAVCPGLPYAQLLRLDDSVQRWVIAVGLSVALTAVVAEALLLTGWYTGLRTVVLLAVVACTGAVIGRLRVRDDGSSDPAAPGGEATVAPIELSS